MSQKISIIILGCPKNRIDSEYLAGKLIKEKFELTNPQSADTILIMTCSFIKPAIKETEKIIKKFIRKKKIGEIKTIGIGGCYVQRFKNEIIKKFPEIDFLFGFDDIENFENLLEKNLKNDFKSTRFLYSKKIPRFISTVNFAYLKISEGCDEVCSFCTIPFIRGKFRSKPIEEIIQECKSLVSSGFKEIILISQSTGLYGIDLYKKKKLVFLLKKLLRIKDLKLLRVFYLHPADLNDEIL